MISFFDIIKHLLPRAKAWNITVEKTLRKFFYGLSQGIGPDLKEFIDLVWLDIFPQTTRELDLWEEQFALRNTGLTNQERRDRLDAVWAAVGGQSPSYIQSVLQSNGFDVYVHEWWATGFYPLDAWYCGDSGAECGESGVECTLPIASGVTPIDVLAPNNITTVAGKGYPLVNNIEYVDSSNDVQPIEYTTPTDSMYFNYFLYIGDSTFGDLAEVPLSRKKELEELCLKICPSHLWIGMLIDYI